MSNTNANNRIIRNTLFMSVRMVIVLCINLFTTRVILKSLGVEDYGLYNVVCGFVSMFTFLSSSISNGIQRFYNFEFGKNGQEGATNVYITSIFIQLVMIGIIIVFSESLGLWYINNKMVIPENRVIAANWIFQFSIISFVVSLLKSPFSASINAHEKMDFLAMVSVLESLLKLVVALILPLFFLDRLILYGFLILGVTVIDFLFNYCFAKKLFDELQFRRIFNKKLFKSMLSFSGWNVFGIFSDMMREEGLNLVLNLFFGPVVNAARAIAYQVSSAFKGFISSISTSVRPQIVQSYAQSDVSRSIRLMYGLSKASMAVYFTLGIPIILEVDTVLRLWLGSNVPEHTNAFVVIVLVISLVNNLNSSLSAIVHASGIMRDYQVYGGVIALLTVPAAYLALRFGGSPEMAMIICLIFTVVMQIVSLVIVKRIIGISLIDYHVKVILPLMITLIVALIIPLIIHFQIINDIVRLIVVSIISVISTVISFTFFGLRKNERQQAITLIYNRIKK